MRRFRITKSAAIVGGIAMFFAGRAAVHAQSTPSYWAGDVSLAPSAEDNLNQPTPREMQLIAPPAVNTNVDAPQQDGPQLTTQTRQVLDFYGGRSARATLNKIPRSTAISSAPVASMPQASRRFAKPFQDETDRPTLSPYLNLYRDEKATQGIPNYQAFVQPQLEQQAAAQRQQIQSQRLQRRGQPAVTSTGGQNGESAPAGASTAAHFMDTAQFYGSWHR
jgi:hypothetical protein